MTDIEAVVHLVRRMIWRKRKISRISQADMAERLGLTQSAYSLIEAGQSPLTLERFIEMCEALLLDPAGVFSVAWSRRETKTEPAEGEGKP